MDQLYPYSKEAMKNIAKQSLGYNPFHIPEKINLKTKESACPICQGKGKIMKKRKNGRITYEQCSCVKTYERKHI